jgi:hypothetical protein
LAGLRSRLQALDARCPLLVKVSPDLEDDSLNAVVDIALECGCDGFIATNTTISREGLSTAAERVEALGAGGLSGAALRRRSTDSLARLARRVGGRVPIIGVGGIDDVESACAMPWVRSCERLSGRGHGRHHLPRKRRFRLSGGHGCGQASISAGRVGVFRRP